MDRFSLSANILKKCLPTTILEDKQVGEKVSTVIEQIGKIYLKITQIEDESNVFSKDLEAAEHARSHRAKLFQILEIIQASEPLKNLELDEKINKLLDIYMLLCAQCLVDKQMQEQGNGDVLSPASKTRERIRTPEQFQAIITNPKGFKPSSIPIQNIICDDPDC